MGIGGEEGEECALVLLSEQARTLKMIDYDVCECERKISGRMGTTCSLFTANAHTLTAATKVPSSAPSRPFHLGFTLRGAALLPAEACLSFAAGGPISAFNLLLTEMAIMCYADNARQTNAIQSSANS